MSTSFFRSSAAVAAVGVGALSFMAGPAGAQDCYPPSAGCVTTTSSAPGATPSIRLSDTTVTRGQTVSATIGGFKPGTSGIVTIASVEQQVGAFTMPATSASTTTTITIPTNISLGAHTVFARGTTANGAAGSASQGVTVIGGGTGTAGTGSGGSTLARTGVYLVPASIIGLGLVGAGAVLKRRGRRVKMTTAA